MIIFIAALPLETIVEDFDTESLISEKIIASSAELNYYGISRFFITAGGKL